MEHNEGSPQRTIINFRFTISGKIEKEYYHKFLTSFSIQTEIPHCDTIKGSSIRRVIRIHSVRTKELYLLSPMFYNTRISTYRQDQTLTRIFSRERRKLTRVKYCNALRLPFEKRDTASSTREKKKKTRVTRFA